MLINVMIEALHTVTAVLLSVNIYHIYSTKRCPQINAALD